MTTYEEDDDAGDGVEEDSGSQPDFDPLLTPWDEPQSTAHAQTDGSGDIGAVWAPSPSPAGHRDTWDDASWWEAPPAGARSAAGEGTWDQTGSAELTDNFQPAGELVARAEGHKTKTK